MFFFSISMRLLYLSFFIFSNGLPPQPPPAPPVYSYLGKRQITPIKVTPAPTKPSTPKPTGGVTKSPKVNVKVPTKK